ncbi:MAG: hypothetical protein ACLQEQ_06085 [Nitrososphaerales archaeon]
MSARRHPKNIKHGKRTLKLELRFWTNPIAKGGKIVPKLAWDSGKICILKNGPQGIERSEYHFHSLSELQPSIEKAFKKEGIKLLHSTKYRKVYES